MKLKCIMQNVRKDKNMTQAQLSKLSGVTITMISGIENNHTFPNIYTLYKLAIALDCKVDDLYIVLSK